MIHLTPSSRQPNRLLWTMDQLIHECSILLGNNLPIDPTPETLSYYITFQSSHICLGYVTTSSCFSLKYSPIVQPLLLSTH